MLNGCLWFGEPLSNAQIRIRSGSRDGDARSSLKDGEGARGSDKDVPWIFSHHVGRYIIERMRLDRRYP